MNIKQSRKQLKWSQQALAVKSGVSRFKISMHECGYALLSKEDLTRVVVALKNMPQKIST